MRQAASFITLATLTHILGYFIALPGHIGDPTWSAHAQYHLVLSFVWLLGFSIQILALAWGPLQQRERRSFWLLLLAFAFAQVGAFVTNLIEPAGRPMELWQHALLALVVLIFAVGLGIAWRALGKAAPAPSRELNRVGR